MILTTGHMLGMAVTILLIIGVGFYAGSKVKSAADFSTGGRKAGWPVVAGTIMGTVVSGASTIGTAQLAFQFGFSAWWFTLGAGIAFAILGLGIVRRFYESSVETIPQYLVKTYGTSIGPITSIFGSVGIFLNLIGQVLAFTALVTAMFGIDATTASVIGVLFALSYVLFGGVWGAGLVGVAKFILLYITMIACGITAYLSIGGVSGLMVHFPAYPWFSLFGRGFEKDFAAGFSLLVGVLSTQTYIQAISSGKTVGESRKGALISAVMIPPIGLGGILVGLFMKANFPATPSGEVFPVFIMQYLPPVLAGVALATLLVTVIGGWAGLTLGISTMLTRDVYQKFIRPRAAGKEALLAQRIVIIIVIVASAIIANSNSGSLILGWAFLSMGLRGCTALCPFLGAMFFSRFVTPTGGVVAALLGPLTNFVWFLAGPKGIDPLYPGLVVSLATLIIVSSFTKKKVSSQIGQ